MNINNLKNLFKSFSTSIGEDTLETYINKKVQEFYSYNPLRNKILDYDWIKTIINQLKNESIKYKSSFEVKSIIDFIQNNIDLQDFIGNENENSKLKQLTDNPFWNETVNNLISQWVYHARSQFALIHITDDHQEYIKEANALYSFSSINAVLPESNADNNIFYDFIRNGESNDIKYNITFDLENTKYISNTNQSYLNLAMPKNSRRVNLMDLNRNFWVISQNVSYLLKYLFPPVESNYTFSNMINKITKELFEMWENVIYLWAILYVAYGYEEHPLHLEFIPLPNDQYCTSKKFDNFDITTLNIGFTNTIIERINFMKKRYPRHNLCVIPIIRANNYEYNYYSNEYYPGLFVKAYNEDNFHYIKFSGPQASNYYMGITVNEDQKKKGEIFLDGVAYAPKTFVNSKYNCSYIQPFSQVDECGELITTTYTSIFRMRPQISYRYKNGKLIINLLKFQYNDTVKQIIGENAGAFSDIKIYGYYELQDTPYIYDFYSSNNNTSMAFNFVKKDISVVQNQIDDWDELVIQKKKGNIDERFYKGECLSANLTTDPWGFVLEKESIPLIPSYGDRNIIQENSAENYEIEDKVLYSSNRLGEIIKRYATTNWRRLIENDLSIIETYSIDKYSHSSDLDFSMSITIGTHCLALWGDDKKNYEYWTLNGAENGIRKTESSALPSQNAYQLYNGAVLYNPITAETVRYPEYMFYSNFVPGGNWIINKWIDYNTQDKKIYSSNIDNYAYLYVKRGQELLANNWVLRYVETTGTLSYKNDILSAFPSEFKEHEWGDLFDTYKKINKHIEWNIYGIPDNKKPKENFTFIHNVLQKTTKQYGVDWYERTNQTTLDILKLKNEIKSKKAEFFKKAIEYRNDQFIKNSALSGKLKQDITTLETIQNPFSGEEMKYYQVKSLTELETYFGINTEESFLPTGNNVLNPISLYKLGTTEFDYTTGLFNNYGRNVVLANNFETQNVILFLLFGHYYKPGKSYSWLTGQVFGDPSDRAHTYPYKITESDYYYKTTEKNKFGTLLDKPANIEKVINDYCKTLEDFCDEWISDYNRRHSSLIQNFSGEKDVDASPIYSKIKIHLFFSDRRYACKEFIQYGDARDKWNYYIIYDNDESIDENDNDNNFIQYQEDLENNYVLYKSNAKRKRFINNEKQKIYLDYEKYPITGFSTSETNDINNKAIKISNPYKSS